MNLRLLALLAVLLWPLGGSATDVRYRVDLILFLDKQGGGESPVAAAPELQRAQDWQDSAALAPLGIQVLPESAFGLNAELQRLRNSRRYQPLLTLAWTQKNPPAERGPRLRLQLPATGAHAAVDGSVALLMGRYLHLDADLLYSSATEIKGRPGGYRLNERRRLRRDELHHLDSPKLGLLVKVSKI